MNRIPLLIAAVATLALAGCSTRPNPQPEQQLIQIQAMTHTSSAASQINGIRLQAIESTATELGAQSGLAWRAGQINHMLDHEQRTLDQTYDFNALILHQHVLPPVLDTSENNISLDNPETIRLAQKSYRIISPARFVTAPPTWRTYLYMEFKQPEPPNKTLLPQNDQERLVWNDDVKKGWQAGITQANDIFQTNVNRLRRDYNGMILYRNLLAQHMVSAPFVSQANLGVTGDTSHVRINDQVLRITAQSELNPNSTEWQPILRQKHLQAFKDGKASK